MSAYQCRTLGGGAKPPAWNNTPESKYGACATVGTRCCRLFIFNLTLTHFFETSTLPTLVIIIYNHEDGAI